MKLDMGDPDLGRAKAGSPPKGHPFVCSNLLIKDELK
jgi:hypothetical protein